MKKANVRAGPKRTIKCYKAGSNATSQGKGRGRQLSAREQLELSRRRNCTVELAASGLDLICGSAQKCSNRRVSPTFTSQLWVET